MTEINDPVEILLVEDNPNDLELTLHALRKNNIANRIHVVSDGEEALDFIFCENAYTQRDINDVPRMILLDLKLPKLDGIEVLRRIKGDMRTRRIPVIMLTTSSEESDIVESYELGANSYIIKPVDFDQFTEAVRHVGFYWLLLNKYPELP